MNQEILGDCLEIMPTLPDKSIDMILCDLPYGTTDCKWDTIIPFEPLWAQYKRLIKNNGAIVLTASQPFTSALVMSNPGWFKYEWIWDKVRGANFFNLGNRPLKTQEQVLVFSKTAAFTFNPHRVFRSESSLKRDPIGKSRKYKSAVTSNIGHYNRDINGTCSYNEDGKKHPVDIIRFSIVEKGVYELKHPTKKPVALFEYLIRTYTNEGDTVLDNCAGSFTTAIACLNTNREYICIEKDEKYFEVGRNRIHNHLIKKEGELQF